MPIEYGVPPPKRGMGSDVGLLCPKPGDEMRLAVLGPLVGIQTHWVNGRTIPCTGEQECRVHHEPLTWKGFLPVLADGWTWRGKAPGLHLGVLVVTTEIGESAAAWPRGSCHTVRRRGSKRNSPLCFVTQADWQGAVDLPPTFDVKPFVLRATGLGNVFHLKLRRAE